MKIKTFGFRGQVSPLPDLEQLFVEMGHQIVDFDTEADLCLNMMTDQEYDKTIEYKKKYPNCKLILNLLNYPTDNPEYTKRLPEILSFANLITTVSEFTTKDVLDKTGYGSKVLYYPIKNIFQLNIQRDIPFLYVGRLYSTQKRFNLIPKILQHLGANDKYLYISGPEYSPFGQNLGFLKESDLNIVYNRSKYVLCPCSYEGSMMMIEGVIAGCFPIVCNDNNWVNEFRLNDFASAPDPIKIAQKIIDIERNESFYREKLLSLKDWYLEKMDIKNIAKRVISYYDTLS